MKTTELALEMLVASIEELKSRMKGKHQSPQFSTGFIEEWDTGVATIHYLERNLQWAKTVLAKDK